MSDSEQPPASIPVQWSRQHGGKPRPAGVTGGQVVRPNARELKVFGDQRQKTCADCKFFKRTPEITEAITEWAHGPLTHEEGWKISHLCADPRKLGLCGMDSGKVVAPQSAACDQYRRKT